MEDNLIDYMKLVLEKQFGISTDNFFEHYLQLLTISMIEYEY
jgi:hypothetical protein